jgi:apolipoprotein N-acyltransferase
MQSRLTPPPRKAVSLTRSHDSGSLTWFVALPQGVILSWGWRRRAIAFLSGAVGALAMPPFSLAALMVVPMTIAVWLIDGSQASPGRPSLFASASAAFGAGWWMGFGYFVAGLWWLGAAFLVDASKFAWALPLGVLALPAGLALFPACGFALARLLWSPGPARILALAFGLGLSEWARSLLFTGFPWNDLGMTLGADLTTAQIASLIGLHGLTFLSIAIFAAPATLWRLGERRATPAPVIAAALALLGVVAFGVVRLSEAASPTVPGVKLRLVQPNISQGADFAPENKDAIVRDYLTLSDRDNGPGHSGVRDVTHLIWPESAFPFILSRDADTLDEIADLLRPGAILVTGAARMETNGGGEPNYYNAIQVLDGQGLTRQRYDKQHLVPFGEYLPFGRLLDRLGVTQFVQTPGGFTPGSGARTLHIPGLPPAMPLICYEAIFPTEIGDAFSGAERPGWLLNLTDDAWFGVTPGPYQHYAQARLRAIELGLPLVRAANSGVSAVVDGLGRETAVSPLGAESVLDAALPAPLRPTWQSRLGSLGASVIAGLFLLVSLFARAAGRKP